MGECKWKILTYLLTQKSKTVWGESAVFSPAFIGDCRVRITGEKKRKEKRQVVSLKHQPPICEGLLCLHPQTFTATDASTLHSPPCSAQAPANDSTYESSTFITAEAEPSSSLPENYSILMSESSPADRFQLQNHTPFIPIEHACHPSYEMNHTTMIDEKATLIEERLVHRRRINFWFFS